VAPRDLVPEYSNSSFETIEAGASGNRRCHIGGRVGFVDSAREKKTKRAQWLKFTLKRGRYPLGLHPPDATKTKIENRTRPKRQAPMAATENPLLVAHTGLRYLFSPVPSPSRPSSVAGTPQPPFGVHELELELELIQTQMTQKQVLRVDVGARALRNQWEGGASSAACGGARSCVCACVCWALKTGIDRKKERPASLPTSLTPTNHRHHNTHDTTDAFHPTPLRIIDILNTIHIRARTT